MTAPQPPGPPPGRAGRGSLMAWARRHKGIAIGGAATAGVAGLALWKRHQNAASSTSTPAVTDTTAPASGVQGTFDSSAQDQYDGLENQISALQGMIGQSSTTAAGSGTTTTVPGTTTTPAGNPPAVGDYPAPAGLAITGGPGTAQLGWQGVTGAPAYHWQVLNSRGGVVADSETGATSALASNLPRKSSLLARVSVFDPSGRHGLWTGESAFKTS